MTRDQDKLWGEMKPGRAEDKGGLPAVFARADDGLLAHLAQVLEGLPTTEYLQPAEARGHRFKLSDMRRDEGDVDHIGGKQNVMKVLMATLREDARSWRSEISKLGIVYELIVDASDMLRHAVDIRTSLHDGKGSGRLSYARTILRRGENLYWLWIDD